MFLIITPTHSYSPRVYSAPSQAFCDYKYHLQIRHCFHPIHATREGRLHLSFATQMDDQRHAKQHQHGSYLCVVEHQNEKQKRGNYLMETSWTRAMMDRKETI